MSNKKVFMAIAAGKESTGEGFSKYIGVGAFNVKAVNPTKEVLEKLLGTSLENSPEYLSKDKDSGVEQVRVDFILATAPEKNNGIELTTKVSFFLQNTARVNKDATKVQVINAYGETTWIDLELAKKGELPENQSWFKGPYRFAFVGEDDLTSFIKVFLNIPARSWRDKQGNIHNIEKESDAQARLDSIPSYFKGNVSELEAAINFRPNNIIKAAVGVKTTSENKEYQDIFTKLFLKSNVKDYSKLDAAIKNAQDNGAYANTAFSLEELHEYNVAPTSFEAPTEGSSAVNDWFKK